MQKGFRQSLLDRKQSIGSLGPAGGFRHGEAKAPYVAYFRVARLVFTTLRFTDALLYALGWKILFVHVSSQILLDMENSCLFQSRFVSHYGIR